MKNVKLNCSDIPSDTLELDYEAEEGTFYVTLCTGMSTGQIALDHHGAKKLQAFLNQNTRKGNRRR